MPFYLKLCELLPYAVAECKVIKEMKDVEMFDTIIESEELIDFKDVFNNIKELLEAYKIEQYKEYTKECEEQIIKLLNILQVDLEYLNTIGSSAKN